MLKGPFDKLLLLRGQHIADGHSETDETLINNIAQILRFSTQALQLCLTRRGYKYQTPVALFTKLTYVFDVSFVKFSFMKHTQL